MVQTSNEQSRKVDVEIRNDIKYYHTDEPQTQKGWFFCYEKQGFFRYSDWHKPIEYFKDINIIEI